MEEVEEGAEVAEEKETATACFKLEKRVIERIRDLSETLGIPQSYLIRNAILDGERFKVLLEAAEKLKKLEKGGG